jgi:hypothetical protein
MIVGILMGAIMGMYAFNGPLKPPKGHESYASLPRRLIRLAHIAFVALPLICIQYGAYIDSANLTEQWKQIGSLSMIISMIGVPTLLIGASFYNPIKYLEVVPVSAMFIALGVIAWGWISKPGIF